MPQALLRFADDLDDPGADLIIAALVINARLRGPGLRDVLGSLSGSVREELDMRRKVTADRRSIRRSVQIVVGVSVGMALALALLDRAFLAPYDGLFGQVVLAVVVGIFAAGIMWLRRLARFETPQRLLTTVWQEVPSGAGHRSGRRVMTPALIAGAVAGLGIFLLTLALIPRRPGLARQLAAFDAAYSPAARARAGWARRRPPVTDGRVTAGRVTAGPATVGRAGEPGQR